MQWLLLDFISLCRLYLLQFSMTDISQVRFRDLSYQYKVQDPITVSYRYAIEGNFQASPEDLVGVFPENAAVPEEALVSVPSEDPARHRLCDGGLYKSGSVTVKCPEAEATARTRYRVWYICSRTGQAAGKSNTFTLCANDDEYLSISFDSREDQSMSNAMQVHTRSISGSYVDVREMLQSVPSSLGSSFVLVSEESSCEVQGSEYTLAQAEAASVTSKGENREGGGDSGGNKSVEEKCSDSTSQLEQGGVTGEEVRHESHRISNSNSVVPGDCPKCPPFTDTNSTTELQGVGEKGEAAEVMVAPDPTEMEFSSLNETSLKSEASDCTEHLHGLKSSSTSNLSSCISSLTPLDCAGVMDMSSSTVIVEKHVTQREAHMLKMSNKELRVKVQKLSEILERKTTMIEGLVKTASESERRLLEADNREEVFEMVKKDLADSISSFERKLMEQNEGGKEQKRHTQALQKQLEKNEDNRRKTESLNKKLLNEKSALEEKVKQRLQEKQTMFERSTKLLTQLQDSETKREVERSEKKVLQVKIDYLGAELRRIKLSQGKGDILSSEQQKQSSGHTVRQTSASSGQEVKQQHSTGRLTAARLESTSNSQRYQNKERLGQNMEGTLRKPESNGFTSSSSHLPSATSNTRPRELPLGMTATPSHNGRLAQASQGRREFSQQSRALPNSSSNPNRKQAMAVNGHQAAITSRLEQEVVPVSKSGHDARNTLQPLGHEVGRDHYNYETLQEGGYVGSGVKREGRELETLVPTGGVTVPPQGGMVTVECPICGKQLLSSENGYEVVLHVERCIQLSEMATT